jgi:hypothetical protein
MADIDYYRITRTHRDAISGEITVAGESFFAMENARENYASIPPGAYTLKMGETKRLGRIMRFIEIPGRPGSKYEDSKPFLIHATRKWQRLAGCIAPARSARQVSRHAGVNTQLVNSQDALAAIFELLGGFRQNKIVTIRIHNKAPGAKNQSKQEFISSRTRLQHS